MQQLRFIFLFIFNSFISHSYATIIEKGSIKEVYQYIEENSDAATLVLFDVTDVLIKPIGLLDGKLWHRFIFNREFEKTGDRRAAFEKEAYARLLVSPHLVYRCVENEIASCIKKLQQTNVMLLAFTAGDPRLAHDKYKHLLACQMDFSITKLNSGPLDPTKDYHIEYGIIFCKFCKSECNKGTILIDVLRDQKLTLSKIIFVDDTIYNLQITESMLSLYYPDIEFVGIHYISPQVIPKNFNLNELYAEIDALQVDDALKLEIISLHK